MQKNICTPIRWINILFREIGCAEATIKHLPNAFIDVHVKSHV